MRILANRILIAVCCFLRRHTPALLGLAYRSLGMLDVAYRDANEHGGVVCIGPGSWHPKAAARLSVASMIYVARSGSVPRGKLIDLYFLLFFRYYGYASGGRRGTREA